MRSSKKRSLRGTSNSHNPQLTWTSAQREAALKVRGDASTYINHEEESSQGKKKTSNAHKRHSASVCKHFFFFSLCFSQKAIHQIFLSSLYFFFRFSWFICFDFMFAARYPVKVDLRAFVHSCFYLSYHLSAFVLHQSECSPRRTGASRGHQSVGNRQSEPKIFNIYCGKRKRNEQCLRWWTAAAPCR